MTARRLSSSSGRTPERYALQLTEEETAMLTRVTSVFDRTVLVLAAPGFIELNEAMLSCSAIVFLGLAGQEAGRGRWPTC